MPSTSTTPVLVPQPADTPQELSIGKTGAMRKSEQRALVQATLTEAPRWRDFMNESDKPVVFIADGYGNAIRHAIHAVEAFEVLGISGLVLFAHGSWNYGHGGIGISYKRIYGDDAGWFDSSYGLYNFKDNFKAAVIALNKSLWVAYYEVMQWIGRQPQDENQTLPRVVIFSDFIQAVRLYCRTYHGMSMTVTETDRETARQMLIPLQKLVRLGSHVEVRWAPSQVSIEGSDRANKLANWGEQYASQIPSGSLGNDEALLPFFAFTNTKELVKLRPLYSGRPFFDVKFWRTEMIRKEMMRFDSPLWKEYGITVEVGYCKRP